MRYLLDTDAIISVLAGKKASIAMLKQLHVEDVAISYITVREIYEGAFAYANPQAHLKTFRQFLAQFSLLTLTDPIMERFAELRSLLRRQGKLIADFDLLLAATALHHNLTVLTSNRSHFMRIPELRVYTPSA